MMVLASILSSSEAWVELRFKVVFRFAETDFYRLNFQVRLVCS
jgi:hypothetical protein